MKKNQETEILLMIIFFLFYLNKPKNYDETDFLMNIWTLVIETCLGFSFSLMKLNFSFFQTGEKVNYCENRKALG